MAQAIQTHKTHGQKMRFGHGIPVPFPVAKKVVFDPLRRMIAKMGSSFASAVHMAPLRTVNVEDLIATQPTVDPDVVANFVAHPDCARASGKRHQDGRPIDLPLVIHSEGKLFLYDGHHRCTAARLRHDEKIVVRLLCVEEMAKMRIFRAKTIKLADSSMDSADLPKEFRIFPMGKVDTSKGEFVFDEKGAKSLMAFYAEQGNELSIDYEHMAVSDPPMIAPAAGYFKLELREDGLWAVDVRWTKRAAEMLANKEYQYFSPAFIAEKDSGRINKLLNVALTNIPATKNMTPLIAASLLNSTINLVRRGILSESAIPAATAAAEKMCTRLRTIEARMTTKRRFTRGVVAGLAKGGFTIQSLIFPKEHWTKAGAKKWVKDHDFAPNMDETQISYRFRQREPEAFQNVVTICLAPSARKAGDRTCKIKAVGGPLVKKAKASAEAVVEPTAKHVHKEEPMARRKLGMKKSAKKNVATKQPARKVVASDVRVQSPAAEMYDEDGKRVDLTQQNKDAALNTARVSSAARIAAAQECAPDKKVKVATADDDSDVAAADSDSDVEEMEDSDSDVEAAADSDSDVAAAADDDRKMPPMDVEESKDSDTELADSDSDITAEDSDSDIEEMEDSDSDAMPAATSETQTNPDTNQPKKASMGKKLNKEHSIASVVATLTGTKNKNEQIGKLQALADAGNEITRLSQQIEKIKARRKEEKIRKIVATAIDKMRLPPAKRNKALAFGRQYGVTALREYVNMLPKRIVSASETQRDTESADVSTRVVAAQLTKEDRMVMEKMGISEEAFIAARVGREQRIRTGQGTGSH